MTITTKKEGDKLTVFPEGRLDTTSAPQLDSELAGALEGISKLVFDLGKLEYMSSAGLRVFLSTQKKMNKQGKMYVKNVNDTIMEIFEITGFSDILNIEK